MKRRVQWALATAALLSLLALAARLALPAAPGWFIVSDGSGGSDGSDRSDVIVMAGSDPLGSSEVEGTRLWRGGAGRCLLCVGRPVAWHVHAEEVMARHLRELGVPAERIFTYDIPLTDAPDAGTVREENRRLLPFLRLHGWRRVVVVTAALESRRRYWLLGSWRRAGLRVRIDPIPEPEFHTAGWWRRKSDTKRVVVEALAWLALPFGG